MLGFNLLPVPMTLYLGHRYDAGRDALIAVATAAGLLYAAIGSIGAVIVATVVPPLLATATPHAVAELELVRRIVFVGLWQTLGTISGACGCWSSACASTAHHHGWAASAAPSASPRWLKRQHEMANGSRERNGRAHRDPGPQGVDDSF